MKILVVADDLTGAADTGLQFAKLGWPTQIMVRQGLNPSFVSENSVTVLNTDSRGMSPREAGQTVKESLSFFKETKPDLIYKKIDSTLRGNIGAEIESITGTYCFHLVAFAPAYPASRRYTLGAYQLVGDPPVEGSPFDFERETWEEKSFIPAVLSSQSKKKVGLIDLDTIRRGLLLEKAAAFLGSGAEILILDSATGQDLHQVALDLISSKREILWVGSAGLASALARNLAVIPRITAGDSLEMPSLSKQVLVVAGSLNKVTTRQVEQLKNIGSAYVLSIPVQDLKTGVSLVEYGQRALDILNSGKDLILDIEQKAGEAPKKTPATSVRIAANLSFIASELVQTHPLAGVVVTGGDIALQTCLHLGIDSLKIVEEVEEGIPLCLGESRGKNVVMVTKAGGFGDENSLVRALQKLKGQGE